MDGGTTLFAEVITIIAVVMSFSIPIWAIYNGHQKRKLLHEERRLMIEHGMVPPPLPVETPWPMKSIETKPALEGCLRRGVIMSILGIGLGIGLVLLSDARVLVDMRNRIDPLGGEIPDRLYAELAIAALIIGLTGLGNLAYYSIARRRRLE